jgi:[acyl-carrier-protein] S-malonyltransferase
VTVAAWVDGAPVEVSDVDRREISLRDGPVAPVLPRERTGEGRQLRRWLVQVLVAERLVEAEAATRELGAAPPLSAIAPDRAAMLGLGSVAADLLTRNPLARAVFVAVTADVVLPPDAASRFYAGNPERFRVPEERVVQHVVGAGSPVRRVLRRGELTGPAEDAVFAAATGDVVGPVRDPLGVHTLVVEEVRPERVQPLDEVRESIIERLLAGTRRRAFTAWLDQRMAERVRLAPGYEHPGDPGQPDNTHRH